MRRKKDDKRVLRVGNNQNNSSRRIRRNSTSFNSSARKRNRSPRKRRKSNGRLVLVMIIALIAFVIGAGSGIYLSFDEGSDDGPHVENVTEEMTTNLNSTGQVYYDDEVDDVDFNENQTSQLSFAYQSRYSN